MASITNPITSFYGASSSPASKSSTGSSAQAQGSNSLANESTFLTLLVSQLKNQDPASPMDGTTFVTQLAQFSDLEQNLAMRTDLDALSTKYAPTSTPKATNTSDSSNQNNQVSGSTGVSQ